MYYNQIVFFHIKTRFAAAALIMAAVVAGGASTLNGYDIRIIPLILSYGKFLMYSAELNFREGGADSAGNGFAESVPVLLYHGIIDKPDGINVTREAFKDHMFTLRREGWRTAGIEEFEKFMRGEISLPPRTFILTFDDGRKDAYYAADPVLRATGFKAVNFIITGYSFDESKNNIYYLTPGELARMQKSGRWELQSHGHAFHYQIEGRGGNRSSALASKIWRDELDRAETDEEFKERFSRDLETAKAILEERLGISSLSFAFPFGDFGQLSGSFSETSELIKHNIGRYHTLAMYQYAPGARFSANHPRKSVDNTLFIKRIDVKDGWTEEDVIRVLENGLPKVLPYEDDLSRDNGWVPAWGYFELIKKGILELRAKESRTGNAAVLDGSFLWQNYLFEARIKWVGGSNVYLWARFQDDFNYAACNFGKDRVHIEQTVDDVRRVIRGKVEELSYAEEFTAGIKVFGRTVQCIIDGQVIVESEFLDPALENGGIGLKVWSEDPEEAAIEVSDIKVFRLSE